MGKSTNFLGQPLLCQLLKFFDKDKILRLSRQKGGERYVKSFDGWHHLVVMLYAVIMRFDSLREITASTLAEARKLNHLGITTMPRRSTLSDANARRPEAFFEAVYRDLLASNRHLLSADSRTGSMPPWFGSLLILDSTTIPLFSNLIFKGVGRNPKNGQKKGGIKVHKIIRAEEGVASDIKFTSAATHDSFMFAPGDFSRGDLLAMDRAYIDYEKLEQLSQNGVVYVTKMKKGLKYKVISDVMYMDAKGGMACRIQELEFTKKKGRKEDRSADGGKDAGDKGGKKDPEVITHRARIVTYPDVKIRKRKGGKETVTGKMVSLLTNDFTMEAEDIIAIYKKRWEIETLFRQIKQNFPLRYFYGESANAIKIQIWVTLIANLLLTLMQRSLKRTWSFSGLATMTRILLMCYVDYRMFFENPERDWQQIQADTPESPPELKLEFE